MGENEKTGDSWKGFSGHHWLMLNMKEKHINQLESKLLKISTKVRKCSSEELNCMVHDRFMCSGHDTIYICTKGVLTTVWYTTYISPQMYVAPKIEEFKCVCGTYSSTIEANCRWWKIESFQFSLRLVQILSQQYKNLKTYPKQISDKLRYKSLIGSNTFSAKHKS